MKSKSNIQLELSDRERKKLRSNKIKKTDILEFAPDELQELLNVPKKRAKEIYALADFQQIPPIGIKFAKDLIYLGYHKVEELKGKSGAKLTDEYEKKKGFHTDPCVEDQFRLAVDFAESRNFSKNWWDFTNERKKYRKEFGYPKDRPKKKWTEV
ncbi:helix-hairpin-helix domain-containing protein [Maribacter sp. 2210JD10-5]|uniref:helix-hairpin-helix domain-containing protein n=1 Tax=Maribacter sp. 2210JD10-5 TaxID=3386272 RepID=UPI0039BD763F